MRISQTIKVIRRATVISFALSISMGCQAEDSGATSEAYDLVIQNGRVLDPDTERDEVLNVGIRDGVIAALTKAENAHRGSSEVWWCLQAAHCLRHRQR